MSNAPISASLSCEYDYTKSKSEYPFFCIECMEPCDKDVCDTCGGEANNRWLLCECEDFETLQKWLPESIEVKQLRARIAELEADAQWKPASEPPEKDAEEYMSRNVLYCDGEYIFEAYYSFTNSVWKTPDSEKIISGPNDKWRELPPLPKES